MIVYESTRDTLSSLKAKLLQDFINPTFGLLSSNIDTHCISQHVTLNGYDFESLETETEDGYILQMSRLKNQGSFNVVYFQHGLCDSSFTWLVHGLGESLGFEARDSGYDVFLGNYRGVYPRKMAKWKKDDDYWFYSIDHIAKYDIHAFLTKIF